jgi:hypothetical protein
MNKNESSGRGGCGTDRPCGLSLEGSRVARRWQGMATLLRRKPGLRISGLSTIPTQAVLGCLATPQCRHTSKSSWGPGFFRTCRALAWLAALSKAGPDGPERVPPITRRLRRDLLFDHCCSAQ